MSNLAEKFLSQGFVSEAQKQCDDALAIEDYHRNVAQTLARLKQLPEDEDKKERGIIEKTTPKSDFYKQFGRAAALSESGELEGNWQGPDCTFTATVVAGKFRAVGTYERDLTGLAAVFAGLGPSQKVVTRYRVEYTGTQRGRAIEAQVSHREDTGRATTSLLGSDDNQTRVWTHSAIQ